MDSGRPIDDDDDDDEGKTPSCEVGQTAFHLTLVNEQNMTVRLTHFLHRTAPNKAQKTGMGRKMAPTEDFEN